MVRVLNSHTDTIHKSRTDEHYHRTECGALSHVDHHEVEAVGDEFGDDAVSLCGRCFDTSGGY